MQGMKRIQMFILFLCTVLSLFMMPFGDSMGMAENQPIVYYCIDSISMINDGVYKFSDDFFTPPRIDGYFPIYLSGWQVDTEKICLPQDVSIVNGIGNARVLNEVWTESIDDNRSSRRRIALLVYLKDEMVGNMGKMVNTVNHLTFQIGAEMSDAMSDTVSNICYEFRPCISQVQNLSDGIDWTIEAIERVDYFTLAEQEPNILYYGNLITRDAQMIYCWKIQLQVLAPWEVRCVLGYQKHSFDSTIVWFNSAEPFAKSSKITLYLLHANADNGIVSESVQSVWRNLQPRIFISPEPFLIGNHIGGPYELIQFPELSSDNYSFCSGN